MIEIPSILEEWKYRDAMMSPMGFGMIGPAVPTGGGAAQEEFDEAAFEALRFQTGGMG